MVKNNSRLKRFLSHPLLALIIGAIIGIASSPILYPNIEAIYLSDLSLDQHGANNNSIRWDFHIQPEKEFIWDNARESWAYFDMDIRNIEKNFDLSEYIGIKFYIKGNTENQLIEFNLFTHDFIEEKEHLTFQYKIKGNLIVPTIWKQEEILFSDLEIATWTEKNFPDASKKPNFELVYAIGFALKTYESIKTGIWIDEMYLIHNNGEKILLSNFENFNVTISDKEGYWHSGWGHN